ncbi:hypothetical protein CSW58_00685 [Caulobacter sp. B11]|nr:hypothetical protein CSW58_00685 [Caulobacter sp. B11]
MVRFVGPWSDVSEGAGYAERTIELSKVSSEIVTVVVQASSYRQGDMDIAPQTITFQPGQTTAVFRTAIYEDDIYEGSEIFALSIVSATNAVIDLSTNASQSVGYIIDNDQPARPMVRFVGPWSDVSEGAGYAERTIELSKVSSEIVTVVVQASSYRQGDMDIAPQTITFQPGQTAAVFRTAIYDDDIYEGSEIFALSIVSATNAVIDLSTNASQSVGYILDNDQPSLRVTAVVNAPASITEGGSGSLSLTLLEVSAVSTSITVSMSGQSTATGADVHVPVGVYSLSVAQSPAGPYTIDLGAITALNDLLQEGVENVVLTVSASGQVFANGSNTAVVSIDLLDNYHPNVVDDFNGDGRSDLAWREAGGMFSTWLMAAGNGPLAVTPNQFVTGGLDNSWALGAAADFNGDGKSDLLWRNADGAFSLWNSTGTGFTADAVVDGSVSADWAVAASGDFNGDGKADLIFRHEGGTFTEWQSTGTGFNKNVYVNGGVDPTWSLAGVGDFNGDGRDDMVWRHDGGTFSLWTSTGDGFAANTVVDGSVSADWALAAIADFNGDGKDDLIWRHEGGIFTEWRSNGAGFDQNVYVDGRVTPDWSLESTGDFNGDGKADLLWRHDTGMFTVWQSTGDSFALNALVDTSVTPNWALASADYALV